MPDVCLQLRPSGSLKEYGRALDFAERCGFDGVELANPPLSLDYERLQLSLLEHGLPVRSVTMPSPASATGLMLHGHSMACDELQPDLLIVPVPTAAVMSWPAYRLFRGGVLLLKETYGDRVSVENTGPTLLQRPVLNIKGLRDFAYEHDVGINFDLSNCAAAGMDILLTCDMLMPRIRNVHFSDFGGYMVRGHQLPGTGLLPLGMLLARLEEYRYKGLITLEVDGELFGPDEHDPVVLYSEIVGFIRSYFGRARDSSVAAARAT